MSPLAVANVTSGPGRTASLQLEMWDLSIKSNGHPESMSQVRIHGPGVEDDCEVLVDDADGTRDARAGGMRMVHFASSVRSIGPMSDSSRFSPSMGDQAVKTKLCAFMRNGEADGLLSARSDSVGTNP